MLRVRVRGPNGIERGVVNSGVIVTEGGKCTRALVGDRLTLADPYELLLPLEPPEVWCAGVTYERSRDARIEESAVRGRLLAGLRRGAAGALPERRGVSPDGRAG